MSYDGEPSFAQILAFMDTASLPALIEWSGSYYDLLFERKRSAVVLFTYFRDAEYCEMFEKAAEAL